MLNWMDGITHDPRGGVAPIPGDKNVIVFHTTETDRPASYSGTEPHFEVYGGEEVSDAQAIRQFIPLDSGAKALYNESGGVETNRRAGHIVQIEIVWRAAKAADMPDTLLRRLALVVSFIRSQIDVPLVAPPDGFTDEAHGGRRFGPDEWNNYAGFAGHGNVPENDHWDPGMFPWDRFLTFLGSEGDLTMAQFDALNTKLDMLLSKGQFANDTLARLTSGRGDSPNTYGDAEAFNALINTIRRRQEEWGLALLDRIQKLEAAVAAGSKGLQSGDTVKITRA